MSSQFFSAFGQSRQDWSPGPTGPPVYATQPAETASQLRPDLAAIIEELYRTMFNRHSDPGGLDFFTQQLIDGVPLTQIQQGFIKSDEYTTLHQYDTPPIISPERPPPLVVLPAPTPLPPVVVTPVTPVATLPPLGTVTRPALASTITLPLVGTVSTTAVLIGGAILAFVLLGGSRK